MFLFFFFFNFFLAINTSSDTKSFVTLNEDINLRSLEEEKEPKKGSQKFQCALTMEEANPAEDIYFCNDANKYTCNATIEGEPYPRCECMKDYANDKGNTTACSYERKKQLTAFLLELFVGFGAGHFYRANYLEASLKLVAFLFGIYIICLFPLTAKCVADSPCSGSLSPQAWPFGSFLTWYGLERTSTLISMTTVSASGVRRTLTQNVLI